MRLLDDDIASRIRVVKNKYNSSEQRYLSFEGKKEITSRIPSWEIAQVLEKLAISYDKNKEKQGCYDVVIATNMIAVGMDVDRLGLMSVVGQPKQNSEYIQATSRVGRQHPGIIFTVYNPYRPRDLSNYENFVGFHSQMYRYVEGTTATPFAARARDRVLHALVVSLLRLQVETMADNGGASNINDISDEQIKDIKDKILERVKITAPSSYVDTEKEMDEFINTWKNIAKDETEIFIRINSKGTALSQSDFVMSKMAADTIHGGNTLRKVVDYFCHLAVKPDFYSQMVKDDEFDNTEYAAKIKWLARDNEDIYDPDYNDMLRVAFMYSFDRAKLADLVSLLSGRDFETREFKEDIVEDSYNRLREGIKQFINEHNFNQFVLAIKGAGYKSRKQLGSQMTLDFAYLLYLKLLNDSEIPHDQIKHHVQKWFVLSTLTGRYVGSPESVMSRDIRLMNEKGFINFFNEVESSVLSDTFWTITLPQNLETTSTNSPAFNTFLAAQVNMNCNSLFMHGTMISDLINISGDVHHIFPKAYLKRNGVEAKGRYNQVANYTYLDTQVNKAVRDDAPNIYFGKVIEQCENGNIAFGNISDKGTMMKNLEENAIPYDVVEMTIEDYDRFLEERRFLMAKLVERYYKSL